jgi:hydrogenase maturation protease
MKTNHRPLRAALGIIGIGNTLVGDDGAGIMVVHALQKLYSSRKNIFFHELTGDFLEMADRIEDAERFIFCDAIAGDCPGELSIIRDTAACYFAPSFHQTDIASVMRSLKILSTTIAFPSWEIWGIAIEPPQYFANKLTPRISLAVDNCVAQLGKRIDSVPE